MIASVARSHNWEKKTLVGQKPTWQYFIINKPKIKIKIKMPLINSNGK
jgi:hypothetical protein